jgi:hypothetical protein
MAALFGTHDMKGQKPAQFVPMNFSVDGDNAKLDAIGGKLSFEIEDISVGEETKTGAKGKAGKKRIVLTNTAAFPFIADVSQGQSHAFHYDDLGVKWDYKDRNAFFSTFASKGIIAPEKAAEKATPKGPEKAADKAEKAVEKK